MENIIEMINQNIITILNTYQNSTIKEAMHYSLMAGGKRTRPLMMLAVIDSYNLDYKRYLNVASAIEMIHTYSLIHDDLPAMDNDDLRRGNLTCHKKFDEAIAILAGDCLLNEAVSVIIKTDIDNDLKIKILKCLYNASGLNGMIYGQQLDMEFENKQANIEELNTIHHYKTGALISSSLMLGALIANENDIECWEKIGYKIGLAFQIQDDILDVIGDSKLLGKNIGSDELNNKSTYVSLMGIEASQNKVNQLFDEAIQLINSLKINQELILKIFESLKKRVN